MYFYFNKNERIIREIKYDGDFTYQIAFTKYYDNDLLYYEVQFDLYIVFLQFFILFLALSNILFRVWTKIVFGFWFLVYDCVNILLELLIFSYKIKYYLIHIISIE